MKKRLKHAKIRNNKYHSRYHKNRVLNVKRIVLCVVMALIVISAVVFGIRRLVIQNDESVEVVQNNVNMKEGESVQKNTETKQEEIKPTTVSIIAVGDNLVSDSVLATAKRNGGGKYDFSSVFEKMKSDFQAADIAIINQETMLGGKNHEYQGYPMFNTPDAMGRAVMDVGFDIVQCASNHSMDTGIDGIQHAIKFWKKHKNKVMMVGLNENEEEYNTVPIYECKGIKFAVLNYTYGLNGITLPSEYSYMINRMDDEHWNKVKSDIEKAEDEADFTIVLPHWGQEYVQPDPTEEQEKWAAMMVGAGADLIIGTHPHVCEKIEWLKSSNGNKALCYYSLGNYTSGQDQWETLLGGMATLTVKKDSKGTRIVKKTAGVIPMVNHYVWGLAENIVRQQYTYRLTDYSEDMLKRHSIQWYDPVTYQDYVDLAKKVFGKFIKE